MIIDTHIHLSHYLFNNEFPFIYCDCDHYQVSHATREELIHRFQEAGITACIDPGIDIESNRRLLCLASKFPNMVFPAVGIHPTRTYHYIMIGKNGKAENKKLHLLQYRTIEKLACDPHVVAIGEAGLDYHLPRKEQHRFRQKMWFIWQIKLANKKKLPLILHIREADADALRILKRYRHYLHGGVCHCFSQGIEIAKQYTELGFKLGVGGTLLKESPRKKILEQAIIQTPIEHILLETDGPYVKPYCPNLSKKQVQKARNTSLILPEIIKRIGELKGMDITKVEEITTTNAKQVFCLKTINKF